MVRSSRAWIALVFVTLVGCLEPTTPWQTAPPQSPDGLGVAPGEELAHARLRADFSASLLFFAVVLPLGAIGGWSLFWWLEHRKRAAAERAFDPRQPLANGHATIQGQVETDESAPGAAIEVVIAQRGSEHNSRQGWHHRWTETSRTVRVRPFWVRLITGQRVRVEPNEDVALRDDLSRVERTARFERTRIAELTAGETVHVSGTLFGVDAATTGSAYRAVAREPVLRASRLAPLLVSTERPGATSTLRANFYRRWFLGLTFLALALPTLAFPTYALLGLTGESVRAQPDATRHWQVYRKPKNRPGYYEDHYGLRSVRESGGRTRVLADECSAALWVCVTTRNCPSVRYTVSALSDGVVQVGEGPQLSALHATFLIIGAVVLLIGFPLSAFRTRPWYLQRKLVDEASGRLPEFVAPMSGR